MEDTNIITILCKILAIRENQYTEFVVEDLNREYTDDLKYVTLVRVPNWDAPKFEIGDTGYLQFQYVRGGETSYFDRTTKDIGVYKYSNNYFINFFKQEDLCKQKEFEF